MKPTTRKGLLLIAASIFFLSIFSLLYANEMLFMGLAITLVVIVDYLVEVIGNKRNKDSIIKNFKKKEKIEERKVDTIEDWHRVRDSDHFPPCSNSTRDDRYRYESQMPKINLKGRESISRTPDNDDFDC